MIGELGHHVWAQLYGGGHVGLAGLDITQLDLRKTPTVKRACQLGIQSKSVVIILNGGTPFDDFR